MAFDPTPSNWIDVILSSDGAEVTSRGPCIIIKLSDLPKLDVATDNEDIRRILWGLIDGLYRKMTSKGPTENPTTVRISYDAAEVSDTRRRANYIFSFDLQTTGQEVRPEPS